MKEYDENEAIGLMAATLPAELRDNDAVCEVLDLIYDYYDENGDLEIDFEDDSESDFEEIADYVEKYLKKNTVSVVFTREQLVAMITAEIEYEESLV